MKSKLINNFGMILLCVTIVSFNLIIGGNEKALPILAMGIGTGLALMFLIIKKVKYKEKLIKNKIDLAVSIFMFTTILPLVFQTYCTYQGTVEFILKYFFAYSMYILARNILDTKKKVNIIIATTVLSSFIIIIFGFDMLYENNLKWLLEILNLIYEPSERFVSTMGYANAVSIYLTFCVFLAINRIENVKNKVIKIIYVLYVILCTYIIYISYSRFVFIIYILSLLIYFSVKLYKRIKNNKKVLKIIIIGIVLIALLSSIYFQIAMQYSKPYSMALNSSKKIKKEFEPNKEYTLFLDLDVLDEEEESNTYLKIVEANKYFKKITLEERKLSKGKQKINFKIKTTEDFYCLRILTHNENKNKDENKNKVIIEKCYINNEEYIFSYKYVPRIIARLITSFNVEEDSIHQRIQFYENCIRIAKDSPIIGHGGNTWKRLSRAYEEYPYSMKESHSYFFELLISYGIVGVIGFISIIVLLCKTIIKELKQSEEIRKKKITIFIGLMLFILYSLVFDFSMSYVLTIFIVFLYIAILQINNLTNNIYFLSNNQKKLQIKNEEKQKSKRIRIKDIVDWFAIILIGICFVTLTKTNVAKYFVEDSQIKYKLAPYYYKYRKQYVQQYCKENIEEIQQIMLKEPYFDQISNFRKYWNLISKKYKDYGEKKLLDYIDFGIDRYKKQKAMSPMYFETVLERAEVMQNAVNILEKINIKEIQNRIQEIKEIMIDEAQVNFENMKDTKRNYKDEEEIYNYIKKYNEILLNTFDK